MNGAPMSFKGKCNVDKAALVAHKAALTVATWVFVLCLSSAIVGCGWALKRDPFFDGDPDTRLQRMEQLPLARQWQIYLYGQQAIHPPLMHLAIPLARQGKVAADYVLEQLPTSRNDTDHLNGLFIFEMMRWRQHFNVCEEAGYLERLKSGGTRIRSEDVKKLYAERIAQLCPTSALTG